MFEKLGAKALAAPVGIALVLCCILSLAVAPILRAEANNVPFIIVNLDEGAVTIAGSTNVGETLTENLLSGESSLTGSDEDDAESDTSSSTSTTSISWTQMNTVEEALEALNGLDYYGAIVIPENFTSQQMSSAVGLGSAAELKVYLNEGKNAQMASTMQTTLQEAMLQAGIAVDVELVNTADVGGGSMASSMMLQMMVMPLMIMTMLCSILTSMIFWKGDATKLRAKNKYLATAAQLGLAVVLSAIVAGLALFVDSVAGGMTLPAGELYPFLWASCLCVMLLFMGLCNLNFGIGGLVAGLVFALGMSCAMLAPEMLPDFWATWVYPWAPQAHIANGVREIIYFGVSPYNSNFTPLLIMGVIGLVAFLLAALVPQRKKPTEVTDAEGVAVAQ